MTARPGFATQQEAYNALIANGASQGLANILAAVTRPESSGFTAAINNFQGSQFLGLWQIGNFHGFDNRRLLSDDINYQAAAALQVYRQQGLGAWETYTNGSYRQYLGQNSPALSDNAFGHNAGILAAGIGAVGEGFGGASQNPVATEEVMQKVRAEQARLQSEAGTPLVIDQPGAGQSPLDQVGAPGPLGSTIGAPGQETIFGQPVSAPHGMDTEQQDHREKQPPPGAQAAAAVASQATEVNHG